MAGEKPDLFRNLRLHEALYEEARLLDVLPGENPLEGIEHKIRLALSLYAIEKPCNTRAGGVFSKTPGKMIQAGFGA